MILGYAPEAVNAAVRDQLEKGSQFSAPTEDLCNWPKSLST